MLAEQHSVAAFICLQGFTIVKTSHMSPTAYGILFSIVAGMMVYIALRELLPTALQHDPKDK